MIWLRLILISKYTKQKEKRMGVINIMEGRSKQVPYIFGATIFSF